MCIAIILLCTYTVKHLVEVIHTASFSLVSVMAAGDGISWPVLTPALEEKS